jgi:hypothetical protein
VRRSEPATRVENADQLEMDKRKVKTLDLGEDADPNTQKRRNKRLSLTRNQNAPKNKWKTQLIKPF